jgi:hypothetical protein
MKQQINDWRPETRSLLQSLIKAGFTITGGNNGEYEFKNDKGEDQLIDDLTACDEANLFVVKDGRPATLFLVYGNNPGELVSDYSYPPVLGEDLDKVTAAHYDKWNGQKQPKRDSPY